MLMGTHFASSVWPKSSPQRSRVVTRPEGFWSGDTTNMFFVKDTLGFDGFDVYEVGKVENKLTNYEIWMGSNIDNAFYIDAES